MDGVTAKLSFFIHHTVNDGGGLQDNKVRKKNEVNKYDVQ